VRKLCELVTSVVLQEAGEDMWIWQLHSSKCYIVCNVYDFFYHYK